MGLGLETGHSYQLDDLDVVGAGFNYVLFGSPGLVQISTSPFYFFSLIDFCFETKTSATYVHREQD